MVFLHTFFERICEKTNTIMVNGNMLLIYNLYTLIKRILGHGKSRFTILLSFGSFIKNIYKLEV